jgi:hypothetical protein
MKSSITIALAIVLIPFAGKGTPHHVFYNYTDTIKQSSLPDLLNLYYSLKDALVNTDPVSVSGRASEFLDAVNSIDMKSLSESDKKTFIGLQAKLAFDARHISEVKSIDHQREHFASLSSNMYKLAKAVKLSDNTVYEIYCPMKKTYWLSKETIIQNPYYGKEMLSCGKVADTIK